MSLARPHALERTSPKGQDFIGTCRLCGTPNLKTPFDDPPCPNQRGLSEDEALIEAIEPPMTTTADLLPNKLRMTAGIEDMAGRPFTARQLREAADLIDAEHQRIAALERDLSIEIDAGHDTVERAEAAELERDELHALSGKGES
jgi:hypothetical protein